MALNKLLNRKKVWSVIFIIFTYTNYCSIIDNAQGSPRQKELDRKRMKCHLSILISSKAFADANDKWKDKELSALALYSEYAGGCGHKTVDNNTF